MKLNNQRIKVALAIGSLFFILLSATLSFSYTSLRQTPVVIAVEKASPSVVNISTVIKERGTIFAPFPGDEFFKDFFPEIFTGEIKRTSLGSGVIIYGKKGLIVTNQHVIEKATDIKVITSDKKEYHATIIGADPRSDIALLKINPSRALPEIEMGDSRDLMIGETVIAIGNPFGLSHTVTTGVVSALDRTVRTEDQVYHHFIQTDASINPGNSGGPLLNIEGKLIGINTAIYRKAQGIGFAIPVNKVKKIVRELMRAGEVRFPWIGIDIQDLTSALKAHFGLDSNQNGVLINNVFVNSPAYKAGIKRGDILLALDNDYVESSSEYREYLSDYIPDDQIKVTLFRKGRNINLVVKAGVFPPDLAVEYFYRRLGIKISTLSISDRIKLRIKNGVIIKEVRAGSNAEKVGLRLGDIIIKINGNEISGMDDFKRVIAKHYFMTSINLIIRRGPYGYSLTLPF